MRRFMVAGLPLAGLILAACSGNGSGTQVVSVTAVDMAFDPTTIEVTAGMPVRLTLMNEGTLEHDFSIMEIPLETMGATAVSMEHDMADMSVEPELHMAAAMGTSNMMEFTPTSPGTYEFFCTVPGHREAGMRGELVVEAP